MFSNFGQGEEQQREKDHNDLVKQNFTLKDIEIQYPLHYLVWNGDHEALDKLLSSKKDDDDDETIDIEQKDPRQRTPLMLAVALDQKECIKVLLDHNASANVTDQCGFNVLHEAVTTADPKLIRDVFQKRKNQRASLHIHEIPKLLTKIRDTGDFYIEMKWEFTSWMPLVSRVCPSDTYKIFKRGSQVRFDSTLLGIDDGINWQRGKKSTIFVGSENHFTLLDINHDEQTVYKSVLEINNSENFMDNTFMEVSESQIADRLSTPIKTSYIDMEKVHFDRCKSGFFGFRTDRVETFNGYECKVFTADNVELTTLTRYDHMTQEDKTRYKKLKENGAIGALRSIIGISEQVIPNPFQDQQIEECYRRNPYKLSLVDYFNLSTDDKRDIGSPKEMEIKKQNFKAQIWMAEDFPLSLREQMLPIVDMLATRSLHFSKLRDFITCKLPNGFPIKIEIPLFHLLNAKITFGNIFAETTPVDGVSVVPMDPVPATTVVSNSNLTSSPSSSLTLESLSNLTTTNNNNNNNNQSRKTSLLSQSRCIVDQKLFEPPKNYEIIVNDADILMMYNDVEFGLDNDSPPTPPSSPKAAINNNRNNRDVDREKLKRHFYGSGGGGGVGRIIPSNNDNLQKKGKNTGTAAAAIENEDNIGSDLGTEQLSIMEALHYDSEKDLQRAIQLSLMEYNQKQQREQEQEQQQQKGSKNPPSTVHSHANGTCVKSKKKIEPPPPQSSSSKISKTIDAVNNDDDDIVVVKQINPDNNYHNNNDNDDNISSCSSASYASCDNNNVNNDEVDNNNIRTKIDCQKSKMSPLNGGEEGRQEIADNETTATTRQDQQQQQELEDNLGLILEQSKRDYDEHQRRQREEEEIFDKVLKLSLIEK